MPPAPDGFARPVQDVRAWSAAWAGDPGGEWHWVLFALDDRSLEIDGGSGLGRHVVDLVDIRRVDEVGDPATPTIEFETVRGEVLTALWSRTFTDALLAALRATLTGDTTGAPTTTADPTSVPQRRFSRGVERTVTGAAIAALVLGVLLIDIGILFSRIDKLDVEFPDVDDGVTTWVLVGSDNRDAASSMPDPDAFGTSTEVPGERADVVMLVQEGTAQRPATVVSVPRDLLVFRRDKGVDRLALTYLDGPSSLVTSICRSLGVAVDHLVVIDFDGIRTLVDHVHGIDVNAEHASRDPHTGLQLDPGVNRLDGAAAVAWVRSRHVEQLVDGTWITESSADQGRQNHQRQLLTQLAARLERQVRHPIRAHSTAWTATGALRTGSNTLPSDLLRLALALRNHAPSSALAHSTTTGHIPVARLTPDAEPVLDQLRNHRSDGPPCPRARHS